MIRTVAHLVSTQQSDNNGSFTNTRRFCIVPNDDSRYGSVAVIRSEPEWVGGALRFRALVVGRCRCFRTQDDSGRRDPQEYMTIPIHDLACPKLSMPYRKCFPIVGCLTTSCSRVQAGVQTRSKAKGRKPLNLRSSCIGMPASIWSISDERVIVERIRVLASTPEGLRLLELDEHLLNEAPSVGESATRWGFWLAAALGASLSLKQQLQLLEETVPLQRLRLILRFLSSNLPVSKPNSRKRRRIESKPIEKFAGSVPGFHREAGEGRILPKWPTFSRVAFCTFG